MQKTPAMYHEEARDRHDRESRLQIWLPAGIALAVLVVAVVGVALAHRDTQVSLIADFTLALLMLCPAALCVFPIAIGLTVAAFGMNRVHDWVEVRLGAVMRGSFSLNRRIDRAMDRLGRAGVEIGTRAAPLEATVFSAFDRPQKTAGTEEKHESSTTQRRKPVERS